MIDCLPTPTLLGCDGFETLEVSPIFAWVIPLQTSIDGRGRGLKPIMEWQDRSSKRPHIMYHIRIPNLNRGSEEVEISIAPR